MFQLVEKRVRNFTDFYQRKNRRPLLGFFVGSEYPVHRYKAAGAIPANVPLKPDDFKPADYLADCDRLFDEHERCGGDFIFAADAFWGIPWLEALLGCEIVNLPETGSIHAEPMRHFNGPDSVPAFNPDSPWAQKAVDFLDVTAEHANGRYPLATTRMRGVADLLSVLYGGENAILKMLEAPDEVKAVCKRLTDFYISFGKLQLAHIPLFHGGVGSFYYNMWAPADSIWHQEDAAALLSPTLYETFILPCDIKIAEAFGGCFMHMHPTGFYPYKQLLKTQMTCLELHIDEGGPSAEQLYDVHRAILAEKPLLIWGDIPEKDMDWIFSKLPTPGLAVNTVVDNPDKAAYYWKKYIDR